MDKAPGRQSVFVKKEDDPFSVTQQGETFPGI